MKLDLNCPTRLQMIDEALRSLPSLHENDKAMHALQELRLIADMLPRVQFDDEIRRILNVLPTTSVATMRILGKILHAV